MEIEILIETIPNSSALATVQGIGMTAGSYRWLSQ